MILAWLQAIHGHPWTSSRIQLPWSGSGPSCGPSCGPSHDGPSHGGRCRSSCCANGGGQQRQQHELRQRTLSQLGCQENWYTFGCSKDLVQIGSDGILGYVWWVGRNYRRSSGDSSCRNDSIQALPRSCSVILCVRDIFASHRRAL